MKLFGIYFGQSDYIEGLQRKELLHRESLHHLQWAHLRGLSREDRLKRDLAQAAINLERAYQTIDALSQKLTDVGAGDLADVPF